MPELPSSGAGCRGSCSLMRVLQRLSQCILWGSKQRRIHENTLFKPVYIYICIYCNIYIHFPVLYKGADFPRFFWARWYPLQFACEETSRLTLTFCRGLNDVECNYQPLVNQRFWGSNFVFICVCGFLGLFAVRSRHCNARSTDFYMGCLRLNQWVHCRPWVQLKTSRARKPEMSCRFCWNFPRCWVVSAKGMTWCQQLQNQAANEWLMVGECWRWSAVCTCGRQHTVGITPLTPSPSICIRVYIYISTHTHIYIYISSDDLTYLRNMYNL